MLHEMTTQSTGTSLYPSDAKLHWPVLSDILGRFVNSIIAKVASEIASTAPHAMATQTPTQTRTACNFETLNVPLGKT